MAANLPISHITHQVVDDEVRPDSHSSEAANDALEPQLHETKKCSLNLQQDSTESMYDGCRKDKETESPYVDRCSVVHLFDPELFKPPCCPFPPPYDFKADEEESRLDSAVIANDEILANPEPPCDMNGRDLFTKWLPLPRAEAWMEISEGHENHVGDRQDTYPNFNYDEKMANIERMKVRLAEREASRQRPQPPDTSEATSHGGASSSGASSSSKDLLGPASDIPWILCHSQDENEQLLPFNTLSDADQRRIYESYGTLMRGDGKAHMATHDRLFQDRNRNKTVTENVCIHQNVWSRGHQMVDVGNKAACRRCMKKAGCPCVRLILVEDVFTLCLYARIDAVNVPVGHLRKWMN